MVLVAATTYLVGPETLAAYQTGDATLWDVAPLPTITVGAAFDAYAVARFENRKRAAMQDETHSETCANCRRDIDPALDFRQWCAADRSASESDPEPATPEQ